MDKKKMKMCLIPLAIKEIQIKEHKFTACRIVKRKKSDNSVSKDVEKLQS